MFCILQNPGLATYTTFLRKMETNILKIVQVEYLSILYKLLKGQQNEKYLQFFARVSIHWVTPSPLYVGVG